MEYSPYSRVRHSKRQWHVGRVIVGAFLLIREKCPDIQYGICNIT